MKGVIVTGTDTGIGKTVVAAMLTLVFEGVYWKPIQCGTEGGTDRETVARLTGLDTSHFRPERYCFREPLSPHRAAELEGVTIEPKDLRLPDDVPQDCLLVIEGAGGLLVPITRDLLQIELFARWDVPAIVCARTKLGTINHTLLTLAALKERKIPLLGILFVGDAMPDSEKTIVAFSGAKRLGRLPFLPNPDFGSLRAAFAEGFRVDDFGA
jgi:dethiobiotin synthetase